MPDAVIVLLKRLARSTLPIVGDKFLEMIKVRREYKTFDCPLVAQRRYPPGR